jgi:ABC-2 type transport system permease protein
MLRVMKIFVSVLTFYFISSLLDKGASPYLAEYGGKYFPFVLIGLAFYEYLFVSIYSISQTIRDEQMMGTLESVLATPTKSSTIIIGSSMWDILFTCLNIFICLLFGVLLFKVDFSSMNLGAALLITVLTVTSFSGIGIISAAFVLVFKKGDPVAWLISVFFGLLGGVYYPVKIMPKFLQDCAYFLPITHSLNGLRLSILKGYGVFELLPDIQVLLVYSFLFLPLSVMAFKLAIKKVKKDGSLVHY